MPPSLLEVAMQRQTLLDALPILAKFLGRKLGVDVVIGAARA